MKIYLDVCCYCWPFDNQCDDIIRFESEAILTIISLCSNNKLTLVKSDIINLEVEKILDEVKKLQVMYLTSTGKNNVVLSEKIAARAKVLQEFGFKPFDALHIACAETEAVDYFVTTDKNIQKIAIKNYSNLYVKIINPISFISEVFYEWNILFISNGNKEKRC